MNLAKVFYRLLGLLLIPLFIVSCSAISSIQPVPTSTLVLSPSIGMTEEVRPGMPTYAKTGSYTVGFTALTIPNGAIEIDAGLFYPVQSDKKPDTRGGPFPLVVFASGWATPALATYGYFLGHFASHGFVAATWEPRGESAYENNDWFAPLAYRPMDYKILVDYLASMTARGGPLEGMIDMKRIVIAGHSMGGGTALEESGAPIDFRWCSAHKDLLAKTQENTCSYYVNYQQEIADYRGLKTIPEGKWPQISDPRIVAMIAMAPMGELWGAEYDSLASVKVPALIMTGSNDDVLPAEYAAYPVYEHLGSQKKSLVVFEQKDHLLFWGPNFNFSSGTVDDLDRIKHITTAFILAEVKGDKEAAKALSSANMKFPGVRFETTEFGNE